MVVWWASFGAGGFVLLAARQLQGRAGKHPETSRLTSPLSRVARDLSKPQHLSTASASASSIDPSPAVVGSK